MAFNMNDQSHGHGHTSTHTSYAPPFPEEEHEGDITEATPMTKAPQGTPFTDPTPPPYATSNLPNTYNNPTDYNNTGASYQPQQSAPYVVSSTQQAGTQPYVTPYVVEANQQHNLGSNGYNGIDGYRSRRQKQKKLMFIVLGVGITLMAVVGITAGVLISKSQKDFDKKWNDN